MPNYGGSKVTMFFGATYGGTVVKYWNLKEYIVHYVTTIQDMKKDIFSIYPDLIKNLPDADIPFKGVHGKLFGGKDHQVVFFDIEAIGVVAEHSHGAQWGVVFEGEMDLTIGGVTKTYTKGDRYFIPSGVKHSANFKKRTLVMDFFEDKARYQAKPDV